MTEIHMHEYTSGNNVWGKEGCPFRNIIRNLCIVSLSSMSIDRRIESKYCSTENHDSCPLFLSRLLRRQ